MALPWSSAGLRQLDDELHALSQPLTALQVRLEIGLAVGGEACLREAIEGALDEARRVFAAAQHAKDALVSAEQELQLLLASTLGPEGTTRACSASAR